VGPDFLRALLRQTVCVTVILLKTAIAKHLHSTAACIKALKAFLRKQLLINAGVALFAPVSFGQWAGLNVIAGMVARTNARFPVLRLRMIVVLIGTRSTVNRRRLGVLTVLVARGAVYRYRVGILARHSLLAGLLAFVIVVNKFTDNRYTQDPRCNAGQISLLAARSGGADRGGGHGNRTSDDYCYESTVHSLFLY
tara:strand:+ start:4609 stop:5196 length:588 start_codon:yes stop_codon:yes gene_type:complete